MRMVIWAVVCAVYLGCSVGLDWTQLVEIGDTAYMLCNDSLVNPTANDTLQWYRESRKVGPTRVDRGDKYDVSPVDDVIDMALEIRHVTAADFGIYRCDIAINGLHETSHVRKGLNLAGPLYDNLLDKYRRQLEVAGIASGSALGLFILTCFVHKFRYRGPKFGKSSLSEGRYVSNAGIYNASVEMTDDGQAITAM